MAFAEKRGEWYRIVFRFGGMRYRHTLKTNDAEVAESVAGGVKRTLMLLEQQALRIPEGTDVLSFVLSGGQAAKLPESNGQQTKVEAITLEQLQKKYIDTLSIGAVEQNSLDTLDMHLRHFIRTLGCSFHLQDLTLSHLQEHVNKRAKADGIRGRHLSPVTIRKEIASLRAAWNWGVQASSLTGPFPNKGLKYPKMTEKAPFQTWEEIEKQIEHVKEEERQELWDCLFLSLAELADLLNFIKEEAIQPFLYPMCCFAGHTGARRSEMLRVKLADLDLDAGTVRIPEKKRVHGKRTFRRVPLSPFLTKVLREWVAVHPGGPFLFSQQTGVIRSKKKRPMATEVTRDEAHDHFKRALAESKWRVIRGWHLFRHSFISLCVMKGIDQRLIDSWVGHTTEEMRRRYTHLYPSAERRAIQDVFGS